MSALCCNPLAVNLLIPSSVLVASFLGSIHCVGMCGGLVLASAPTFMSAVAYHLGRLIGYCTVGGIIAFSGKYLLGFMSGWMADAMILVMGSLLIVLGVMQFRNRQLHVWIPWLSPLLQRTFFGRFKGQPVLFAFSVGLGSVFLPCGWLYAMFLALIPLGSFWLGAGYMALFWLGALPALIVSPLLFRELLAPFSKYLPWISGAFLIGAGLMVFFRFS